jgi:aminopeptidase N
MSGSFAAALRHAAGLCRCRDQHESTGAHGGAVASSGRPFPFQGTKRVYERDRPFVLEHIALDLALDVPKRSVEGTATLTVRRVDAKARKLRLDAIAFEIAEVRVAGKAAEHEYDDATLSIDVPAAERFDVVVRYRVTPKRGLYFLEPDEHVRERPRQVWTQCQDEDARYWFPCHDKPHVKQTTELCVRVPKAWTTLSNGVLVAQKEDGDTAVFHWKQEQPHASYLVTLVAGEFAVLAGEGARVPVSYYVPKGREVDGARTFGRTPQMIELFEKKTGIPYPWPKYAQVVVSDFIFGGMENTSATTMYEHILLDERGALDVDMDGLVAHELAHQWFGDYVTCRDWSEGWLNEGWATYMELVWKDEGHDPHGHLPWETFGRDDYDYAVKGELDIYLAEDGGRYRRPIVCRDYENPIDLFDRHLYQKGALVLHVLRRTVGDEVFWRAVNAYLKKHAFGNVESRDFQRALEAESGKSLDRVFDAYVHGSGHPELEVLVEYDDGQLVVSVKQTQKVDHETRLWEGPLVLDVVTRGKVRRETVQVRAAKDSFVFNAEERPGHVAVDPDGDLLGTIDLKVPGDMLRDQLEHGTRAKTRWTAAIALAKRAEPKTIAALAAALKREEEFWGVRAEAAEALGEIRGEVAFAALRDATKIENPKVRRAVTRALGKFRTPAAAEALTPLTLSDPSYYVQADAARALGSTRQTSAFDTLVEVLDRKAWADAARSGAADGLANLRDERAVAHLTARTTYGHESPGRRACLMAIAKLDTSKKTRELLEERLDDVDMFVRIAAIRGLETLSDAKSRPALSARLDREDAGTVRRRLREALRDLAGSKDAEVRRLRDEVEKMRDESHELKQRLAKLEARLGQPEPKPEPSKPATRRKTAAAPRKPVAPKKKPKGVARAAGKALKRSP